MVHSKRNMALGLVGRDVHVKRYGPVRTNRYLRPPRLVMRMVVWVMAVCGVVLLLASTLAR
jgi:hypothetical protein